MHDIEAAVDIAGSPLLPLRANQRRESRAHFAVVLFCSTLLQKWDYYRTTFVVGGDALLCFPLPLIVVYLVEVGIVLVVLFYFHSTVAAVFVLLCPLFNFLTSFAPLAHLQDLAS